MMCGSPRSLRRIVHPLCGVLLLMSVVSCARTADEAPFLALGGQAGAIVGLAFSPDDLLLAARNGHNVSHKDNAVVVWNVSKKETAVVFHDSPSDVGRVAFSLNGRFLAADEAEIGAVIWDLKTKKLWHEYRFLPYVYAPDSMPGGGSVGYGWGVAFSPDTKLIAVGGSHLGIDGTVSIWDVESGENVWSRRVFTSPTTAITFSPDGSRLACGSLDGEIATFAAAAMAPDPVLMRHAHAHGLTKLVYSHDGARLISASTDGTIKNWDVGPMREIGRLSCDKKPVFDVALQPDGKRMATAHDGGLVIVWDLTKGVVVRKLQGHKGRVRALAYSHDGSLLASGGSDQRLLIWKTAGW
jgi:WD40 repeat protein